MRMPTASWFRPEGMTIHRDKRKMRFGVVKRRLPGLLRLVRRLLEPTVGNGQ
jgi:hypothetical protein